jgi:hypothetical protein
MSNREAHVAAAAMTVQFKHVVMLYIDVYYRIICI